MRANRGNTANAVNATGPGSTWQHVGPNGQDDPPKSFGFGYGHESGRDISIVISPADPNTIFVGTAGGGVWKSADGGTSWTTTTDNQASLAIAPTTPYTVYALTGEGNFSGDSYYGAGLLRSTDGGASWTQTGTSLSRLSANKLAVDPTSPAILYAALTNGGRAQFPEGRGATTATGGIYRSLDSGATWALSLNPGSSADSPCAGTGVMSGADTLTYDSSEAGTDIAVGVDPATPTNATIYAALGAPGGCPNNGIYKGVDHGQTWTPLTAFTQTVPVLDQGKIGRISLSTMPGNPQVVYASASITGGNGNSTYLEGVYESTNGGATWARVTNPDPSTGAKPGTQYDYDTYIAVDPLVSSTVFVAGTDVFKSTNSGGTWANVTNAYGGGAGIVHGDQHALAFVPRTDSATTPTIFIGNDGGLYRSTNGGDTNTWSNSDSGIEARQIYHSAVSAPGQPTQYYIGLQDNNVSHYTGRGQWLPVSTGDGMNAAVALTNSDIAYIAVQNDQISVTTNGGQRFTDVSDENDIKTSPAVTDKGRTPFVTAFALDPSNPNRLLVGTYRLWETTDSGASWHTTGTGAQLTNTGGGVVDTLAIAPTMTSTVYAGTNDGLIQTSIDGGATFTRGTGLPGRAIGGIAVSPITSTTAWAGIEAFNAATPNAPGHVFQTTDGGQTWNDVTGNLPDTPVNGIATGADGRVYVATDTGVFSSPNATSASATWTPLGDSLPNAPIFDVTLNSDGTTLYASTHGRGLWSLPVSSLVSGTATGTATTGTATGTATTGTATGTATTGTATGMGTTITVCSSGCNYTTIEDALANASDGYTISISPGVYTPTRTLDISNNITLLGQDTSTGKAADVTVDGSNNGRAPVVTVESGKSVTINGLTLTKGVAGIGGGISNNGTLTILDSTISGNTASSEGAGIYNPGGPVLVVNSTIANNVTGPSGDGGSAVMNQAQLTVINSTISGNSLTTNFPVPPSGFAGGIYSTSSTAGVAVTLTNSLIAGNTFTDNNNNAPITSESDFVDQSGNSSGSYMGTPTSGTYTDGAIGGSHMGSDADNIVGRSYNNQTYALSGILTTASGGGPALTDNGGHTQTIAPSANSPAIDHGDNNTCQAAPVSGVDQRGVTRPQPADGSCDIGAVEVGATAMGTGTATTGPTGTATTGPTGTMATGTAMTGTATGTVTTGPTSTATTGATGTATVGTATASPSSVATGSVTAAPTGTATTGAATSGPTRTATAGTATTGPTGSATAGTATTTTGTATTGPAGSATAGTATGTATTSPIATSSVTAAPTGTTTGPSATNTNTATSSPTNTSTSTRTATATNTATGTNTATATDTNTATSTNTAVPSTNTSTNTPTATATATATSSNTPVPSTNTATMVLPTGTNTSAPPTGTNTSLPSTASATTAPTSTGVPPTLARRFCIAGGVESANVHSALAVLNPNSGMAHNAVTFYFADGTTRTASFTVPANAQRSVSVAGLAGRRGSFGLCVSSDRSISGQLNLTRPGRDGDSVLGNPALGTHWYLAEGYTGLTFHETVALLNPSAFHPATVRLRLLLPGGKGNRTVTERVGAHSERLVNINSLVSGASVSIVADADRAVLVERTLTFSAGGYGLTTRGAAPDAATSWLFAEGSTAAPFQTFLTVLNPQGGTANVTATFFGSNGQRLGRRTLTLAARNRATLRVNDIVPHRSGVASVVTSDRPVVVERPEYFGSPNNAGVAGSDVFGRTSAARQWSIPGGVLRGGDSEFLLLYNPSPRAVPVDITFYKGTNGRTVTTRVTVPAQARYTFDVTAFQRGTSSVPGLRLTASHGAVLRARNNQTFIVERSVFGANHSTLQASEGLAQ